MSTTAALPQSFPCPYTTSGCPLFNSIELPKPNTPSCSPGCSPAPSSNSLNSDSLKLRPIGTPQPLSPGRLPSLDYTSSFPSPRPPITGVASNEWNGYLDFGLQPSEVDLAPLYVPFPQAQAQPQSHASTSTSTSKRSGSGSIWDIEELVSGPSAKKPRVSSEAASPQLDELASTPKQQQQMASGLSLPVDQSRASPASSEGGNEVITPFISKLSYLLDHQEYQPWIRWDASGNYILIAHTKPHLLEILARYFRHTTIASFVRQLNIYGFKRVSTGSLLSILDSVSLPHSVLPPNSSTPETFSASDYSAFHNDKFFMSIPGSGGRRCKLGGLKPITKERGPRNRSKKAKDAAAAERKRKEEEEEKGTSGTSPEDSA